MNLFLFGFSKTETGAKTAPRVPKLGYFDGRVPKLSFRVTLAMLRAGVFCYMSNFLLILKEVGKITVDLKMPNPL